MHLIALLTAALPRTSLVSPLLSFFPDVYT